MDIPAYIMDFLMVSELIWESLARESRGFFLLLKRRIREKCCRMKKTAEILAS